MIKFVYGICPAFIKVGALPPNVYGRTNCMFVSMAHGYNHGQLEHELVHVRQFYRTFGLHPILNALSKGYRLACEFEAYREQLRWGGNPATMAHEIATHGGFGITEAEAYQRLIG